MENLLKLKFPEVSSLNFCSEAEESNTLTSTQVMLCRLGAPLLRITALSSNGLQQHQLCM